MMGRSIRILLPRPGQSTADAVYEELKKEIVLGSLEPSARIDEVSVAERFRVSRTPIREALRRLEQDGLVDTVPRRGTIVRRPTLQDLVEIDQIRLLLEPAAARMAAGRVNADALTNIEAQLDRLSQATDDGVAAFVAVDWQLHDLVVLSSGNTNLRQVVNGLHDRLAVVRARSANLRVKAATAELKELVGALRAEDADRAEAAMRNHLTSARANRHRLLLELSADNPSTATAVRFIAS